MKFHRDFNKILKTVTVFVIDDDWDSEFVKSAVLFFLFVCISTDVMLLFFSERWWGLVINL